MLWQGNGGVMTDYDLYISTNPAEREQEIADAKYISWVNNIDNPEDLQGYIQMDEQDLMMFCTDNSIDFHDDDVICEMIKIEYAEELLEYFENNEL